MKTVASFIVGVAVGAIGVWLFGFGYQGKIDSPKFQEGNFYSVWQPTMNPPFDIGRDEVNFRLRHNGWHVYCLHIEPGEVRPEYEDKDCWQKMPKPDQYHTLIEHSTFIGDGQLTMWGPKEE